MERLVDEVETYQNQAWHKSAVPVSSGGSILVTASVGVTYIRVLIGLSVVLLLLLMESVCNNSSFEYEYPTSSLHAVS
jgi:ABC-type transport system involved in cytochrome bd biosynthesis fused ATPase/permease subunit